MRILLIAPNLRPESGWGTFSVNTAEGLLAQGHEVLALVAARTEHPCPQRTGLTQAIHLLDSKLARMKTAFSIAREARRFRPDVIHFLVEPYALALPLLARFLKLPPCVLTLHGTYSILPFQYPSGALLREAYAKCEALLCCSDFTKGKTEAAVREYCGDEAWRMMEKKIRRFRFGIKPAEMPSRVVKDAVKRIIFVGEVKQRKGILELINAAAAYKKLSKTPFVMDIIGRINKEDPYAKRLMLAIEEQELRGEVRLRGHVSAEELNEAYASADLFMMLSRSEGPHYEGFGLVILEAASRGIPVIGSTDAGCAEALKEGVTGYGMSPTDTDGIASRMKAVLDEGSIDAAACRAWANEHTISGQCAVFEEVYRAAVTRAAE